MYHKYKPFSMSCSKKGVMIPFRKGSVNTAKRVPTTFLLVYTFFLGIKRGNLFFYKI